jgi:adenylate cyclase
VLKARRAEILKPLVAKHHGRIIKFIGDGVLIEFASAVNAVACAGELQAAMNDANETLAEARRIILRVGVNLGDVTVEGSDLYGEGINIAARLEGLAKPGEVLVSQIVFGQVRGKVGFRFEDLGEKPLKNIAEPVRVYRRTVSAPAAELPPRGAAEAAKPSLAVLPFTNMSGDPEQEYFSDGITEDIITDLSQLSALFVVARHSAFMFKGKAVEITEAARQLNVAYVLEGSVRKAGNRVRITANCSTARLAVISGPSDTIATSSTYSPSRTKSPRTSLRRSGGARQFLGPLLMWPAPMPSWESRRLRWSTLNTSMQRCRGRAGGSLRSCLATRS